MAKNAWIYQVHGNQDSDDLMNHKKKTIDSCVDGD